jgi:hypothetical protein
MDFVLVQFHNPCYGSRVSVCEMLSDCTISSQKKHEFQSATNCAICTNLPVSIFSAFCPKFVKIVP